MRQFEGDSIPYTKATGHTPRSSIGDALAQPDSVRRRSSGRRGPACDFHAKDRAPPQKRAGLIEDTPRDVQISSAAGVDDAATQRHTSTAGSTRKRSDLLSHIGRKTV